MPEPQQATPQTQQPQREWYKTQGDDGQWYQTQAASLDEAKQKLSPYKKAWATQPKAGPAQSTQPTSQQRPATDGYKPGFWHQLGPDLAAFLKPSAQNPYPGMGIEQKAEAQYQSQMNDLRREQEKYSRLYRIAAPVGESIGINATGMEESAKHGDVKGVVGHMAALPLVMAVSADLGKIATNPKLGENLKTAASKIDAATLKTAKSETTLSKTLATGRELAAQKLWGARLKLPEIVEKSRLQTHADTVKDVNQATQSGKVVDLKQDVDPILIQTRQILNRKGVDQIAKPQIEAFLDQLENKTDPQTGARVKRDFTKLSPKELYDLMTGEQGTYGILSKYSKFEATRPDAVNNLARRIRETAIQRLDEQVPGVAEKMRSEHELILNRDAATELRTNAINGKMQAGRAMLYSASGLALYAGMHALGLGGMGIPFIGTIVLLKGLSTVAGRTLAARLLYHAGTMWDHAVQAAASAPSGPLQPNSPTGGGLVPNQPQPVANRALTGQTGPPFASASVAQQNAPAAPMPRGTALPASATRARAGSGDYVKGETPKATKPVAAKTSVAQRNVSQPPNKVMMDRLDVLQERRANPKSGADRNAIEREIGEIKQILKGEDVGTKHAGAPKRIADRERLAEKRASAAATSAPASQAAPSGEAVSQIASPELRAMALDAGYKKLATYEGGPEMVKAAKATAKAMEKLDPSYDEVEKLTEILGVMKEITK
jgi:hypothetical protein